jgi:hypothetical protein
LTVSTATLANMAKTPEYRQRAEMAILRRYNAAEKMLYW